MRLHLILPRVEPDLVLPPTACPNARRGGQPFRRHQSATQPVRDTVYAEVMAAERYECLRCHRPFRVYPPRLSEDHTSRRVKGLAVRLCTCWA